MFSKKDELLEEIGESIDKRGNVRQKARAHWDQLEEHEERSPRNHRAWFATSTQVQIRAAEHQLGGYQSSAVDSTDHYGRDFQARSLVQTILW